MFIQNYNLPHWRPALLEHTWSLAIEEHFYIALPLVLLLLGRKRISAIPGLFVAVALVCLFLRWNADRAGIPYFVYRTHLRIDGLMAGVAIAYFYRFQQKRFRYLSNRLALAVSPFLFLPPMLIPEQNRFAQIYGVTALYMGFGVLLSFCVDRDLGRFLGRPVTRVLARIGRDSYCIYLWHYPISRIFGGPLSAVQFWTFLVLSVAIGVSASSLIERPFLRLREKIVPRGRTAASGPNSVAPAVNLSELNRLKPPQPLPEMKTLTEATEKDEALLNRPEAHT